MFEVNGEFVWQEDCLGGSGTFDICGRLVGYQVYLPLMLRNTGQHPQIHTAFGKVSWVDVPHPRHLARVILMHGALTPSHLLGQWPPMRSGRP